MKKKILVPFMALLVVACHTGNKTGDNSKQKEDRNAKAQLQGIWIDDDSETPLMRVFGDTIYYVDPQNIPVYFKIINDSIYMYGSELSRYKIDKQSERIFWVHSLSDNILKLHKSEDSDDSLAFSTKPVEAIPSYSDVTKKDSVIMYKGKRYHAYVYINPSKMKVVKTSYSEEGLSMDNVYYDNVIHICVYEGRKSLYASDITKKMFTKLISSDFLSKSVLSDMQFLGVGHAGFHYQASVNVPESSVCNLIDIFITFKGEMSMKVVK
ncbi:DUF4738 domain-containing protein [uncultured Bacteroides sp.]|uniref:DUF4738 domain-containing protein n=1 Tax=uncultured Bacteroides sp. TaxID=162156 RepID=UPI002AABF55C|nr:DUF4738 domain-containing protein [uncultured Bacteroides sp.]